VNKLIQRNAGLYQVTFLDTNFEINICYLHTYYFGAVYCNNTYIEWLFNADYSYWWNDDEISLL